MDAAVLPAAEPAPAKINLALHVTGRRADGYHLLESLVVFAEFGDRLTVGPATHDRLSITGPQADSLTAEADNLVVRARELLRAEAASRSFTPPSGLPAISPSRGEISRCGSTAFPASAGDWRKPAGPLISPLEGEMAGRPEGGEAERHAASPAAASLPPVSIRLEKNLPVAAGIGGGSADAAAALRALDRFWRLGLGPERLAALGQKLGADVPMCLASRPLVARGIGEALEPVAGLPALPMVLVNPGVAVATPPVFAALSRRDNPPLPPLPARGGLAALIGWLEATRNDLEAPALTIAPAIAEALAALRSAEAAFARMSGSGASCFGLFGTAAAAASAADAIRRARPGWFVAATVTTGGCPP